MLREPGEASDDASRPIAREHHVVVPRTARYCTLGDPGPALRDVWFVCHGYGQLARYFIRHFAPLDDGTRLIVAPEAMSRFYVAESPPGAHAHAQARVGATWMTREDREAEISDYVAYLDAVHDRVFEEIVRADMRVTLLGFSQGVATAARWAEHGRVRPDHLIAWAGAIPADVLVAPHSPLRAVRLTAVLGTSDEHADPVAVAAQRERLASQGLEYDVRTFEGGHRMHAATLLSLAERAAS